MLGELSCSARCRSFPGVTALLPIAIGFHPSLPHALSAVGCLAEVGRASTHQVLAAPLRAPTALGRPVLFGWALGAAADGLGAPQCSLCHPAAQRGSQWQPPMCALGSWGGDGRNGSGLAVGRIGSCDAVGLAVGQGQKCGCVMAWNTSALSCAGGRLWFPRAAAKGAAFVADGCWQARPVALGCSSGASCSSGL